MERLELVSQNKSFDGWVTRYRHKSAVLNCDMVFGLYLPPHAAQKKVPLLVWLSGLTCTDENFMQKAGAQRLAAELGMAIVCPDTSPRGTNLPGEHERYDLGSGAGFYINATQQPWAEHYRMYDYVTKELPDLFMAEFPLNGKTAISGHSMGGHGALICALKNPGMYTSVSAFSPICHPVECGWGQQVFTVYLGDNTQPWLEYDACELVGQAKEQLPILIDQGEDDEYITDQLKPEALVRACEEVNYPVNLRMHKGYDHSYYFIASFIDDHLRFHANALGLS